MIRVLTILAAGAALAVSASPASAGSSTKLPPRGFTYTHMEEVMFMAAHPRAGVMNSLGVKYTAAHGFDRPMESVSFRVKAARPKLLGTGVNQRNVSSPGALALKDNDPMDVTVKF